jgi:hypothetical protein
VGGFGRPADRGAGSGFDHELLLRVGVLAGGEPRTPAQLTGSAAARVPAGRVRRRSRLRLGERTIELALVQVGSGFVLDQFEGDRRLVRVDVPGMRPGAQVTRFLAAIWGPENGGIDVSFVNPESARVVQHTYDVTAGGLSQIR